MKINIYCLLLCLVCSAGTCNKNPFSTNVKTLYLKNKSSQLVVFYVGFNHPDTAISVDPSFVSVSINEKKGQDFSEGSWENVFQRTSKDTLNLFVFSSDTLRKYTFPEIRIEYKILKRYDLSQQDLEAVNYTITYP